MANEENLIQGNPETQFKSGREAVENGRKGGIASGKAKREKKTSKELAELLLSLPIHDGELEEVDKIKSADDIGRINTTQKVAVMSSLIKMSRRGDVKAIRLLLELIGEAPEKNVESNDNDKVMEFINSMRNK